MDDLTRRGRDRLARQQIGSHRASCWWGGNDGISHLTASQPPLHSHARTPAALRRDHARAKIHPGRVRRL